MKRILIIQPVRGLTYETVMDSREAIKQKVETYLGEEVCLINSFSDEDKENNFKYSWYPLNTGNYLKESDIVVFADTENQSFYDTIECTGGGMCAIFEKCKIIDLATPSEKDFSSIGFTFQRDQYPYYVRLTNEERGEMSCLLKKKKIFISQPMRGIPADTILTVRESVKRKVEAQLGEEVEVIDQFNKDNFPDNAGPLMYLGDSIMKMDQADIIVFTDTAEWSFYDAKGCLVELAIAKIYCLEFINLIKPISKPKPKDEFMFKENVISSNKKRYDKRIKMNDRTFNIVKK